MDVFVERLQQRTKELGLSNADVARRLDVNERTYGHYAAGRREPNLQMLTRIADALQSTPNFLLGVEDPSSKKMSDKERLTSQAQTIVNALDTDRARLAVQVLKAIEENQLRKWPS